MCRLKGFTLVELLVVVALLAITCCLLPLAGLGVRDGSRQIKDATQVRDIHRGMTLFAANNGSAYPVPGQLDKANIMIAAGGRKDLPRHVVSILIYNGFFAPEAAVSPAEVNPAIRVDDRYRYREPDGLAVPSAAKLALWDPGFKATPRDAHIGTNVSSVGNVSYGMMPFVGNRRARWSVTSDAAQAVLGNRGPAYDLGTAGTPPAWTLVNTTPNADGTARAGVGSNTLRIHGSVAAWEGNIAYNDNRVAFETRPDPETLPFTFTNLAANIRTQFDNLFVNENDATRVVDADTLAGAGLNNTNNFLRTWWDCTVTDGATTAIAPYFD